MEEDASFLDVERQQIEQIRELDFEELQVEEVDGDHDSDDDHRDPAGRGNVGTSSSGELTFNASLVSLHTYLGDVEEIHHRLSFLEGGAILTLPVFYLEGAVLFPEAILPLRVIHTNFIAAIERAMTQADAHHTLAVVWICRHPDFDGIRFGNVGTTAEIRQYRQLEDGSMNVVTRGQQRFRLRRCWVDSQGVPCAEVQIIQEDLPLRTPRDVVGELEPLSNLGGHHLSSSLKSYSCAQRLNYGDDENGSDENSEGSFETELSPREKRLHQSAIVSCSGTDVMDESVSSDDDGFTCDSGHPSETGHEERIVTTGRRQLSLEEKGLERCRMVNELKKIRSVSRAFWPSWVYSMYDSYCLAQRVADMWKRIVGSPNMDGLVRKPDLLSFYIGSKIPVSDSKRQELLEIDGISYRLHREIELLESFDRIRCKNCQTVIARRRDMLVMSNEGPLGAYVNPHGYVHEIMTFYSAHGLALIGRPATEFSWFPGYAWTITNCATCESNMGWLFTATNRKLKPKMFWAIRSCQVSDDAH